MSTNTITSPDFRVISQHTFADVVQNASSGQKSLHATVSFSPGDVICPFGAGITQDYATYLTVQTGTSTHITLMPEFLQYINHSCAPNVFFDTTAMQLVCLRPLQPGDEMTFFYPSTEWEMAQPFVCNCGTKECLQLINGASHLSPETLRQYRLTDFIKEQAKQKLSL
jgi:hypothetical protein